MKFSALILTASLLIGAPAFAQTEAPLNEKPATAEINSNGQTLVLDPSQVSNIQFKADKVVYDAATSTFSLEGKSKIAVRSGARLTRLEDDRATVRASEHLELQIDAGGSIEVDQDAPIRELAAALKHGYPPMNYRVQWGFSVFQYYSDGTALYDQRDSTLSEYIREGDEDSGSISRRFYRGVTDEILIQMAEDAAIATQKANQQGSTKPFDFRQLTKYGCTVVDIK